MNYKEWMKANGFGTISQYLQACRDNGWAYSVTYEEIGDIYWYVPPTEDELIAVAGGDDNEEADNEEAGEATNAGVDVLFASSITQFSVDEIAFIYGVDVGGEYGYDFASNYKLMSNYETLAKAIMNRLGGYYQFEIVQEDDYQGDGIAIAHLINDKFAIMPYSFGSCSGCDALLSCTNARDVTTLANELLSVTKIYNSWHELETSVHEHIQAWWHVGDLKERVINAISDMKGGER